MDDVNPQASAQLQIARVELDCLQDDSHDLTSQEIHNNQSSSLNSDEPRELLITEDKPIIGQETSKPENIQTEEQTLQQPLDQDAFPIGKISAEDEKSLKGLEFLGDKFDHATSSKPEKRVIDTSTPIESVKDAVSKFGGLVNLKAHKTHTTQKSKIVKEETEAAEEMKMKTIKELDSTNRLIEELKLNLERAQAEELQAKQDSELAKLRVKEMGDQENANMASVTSEGKVEDGVVSELKCVKEEMEDLQKKYASLLSEKEVALRKAKEVLSRSKEIEKGVDEMKLRLISTKETLESANAMFLEAKENRNGAAMVGEQEKLVWEKELKQAEEDVEKLKQQVEVQKELKGKLNTASNMLVSLKTELRACKEMKLHDEIVEGKNELEELKVKTDKTRKDTESLIAASKDLKRELEQEKSELVSFKQKEDIVSGNVVSLEVELKKIKCEIDEIHLREQEVKKKMMELPRKLEVASQEAYEATLAAKSAREGLRKVQEEVEQAKERTNTIESQLVSVQKKIDIAKASEKVAMDAIKELQESGDLSDQVMVTLEEYNDLSKRAQEAEDQANIKAADVMAQVEKAKEAEMKALGKLEEANQELLTRKEVYAHAINKAEMENEAKLVVEQEFRKWSDENEPRRENVDDGFDISREETHSLNERKQATSSESATSNKGFSRSDSSDLSSSSMVEHATSMDSSADIKAGKKKKRHFFPHIFMLFSKKKASSRTS